METVTQHGRRRHNHDRQTKGRKPPAGFTIALQLTHFRGEVR